MKHPFLATLLLMLPAYCVWSQTAGSIAGALQSYNETKETIAAVADYPYVDYAKAQEVAPKLSDNDIDMIYEFLFVDADATIS